MGQVVSTSKPSYLTLYMIRMQQKNITVNEGKDDLGSILYADSFLESSGQSLNLTKNVPNMLAFYTSHKHYQNLSTTWHTEKQITCEKLGVRQFVINTLEGVLPLKRKYAETLPDFILKGKLVVYEKALIFEDSSMHNFMISYDTIEQIRFYTGKTTWAEIMVNSTTSFPMNSICENKIYINVGKHFYSKNLNLMCTLIGEDKIQKLTEADSESEPSSSETGVSTLSEVLNSMQYKNYQIELKKQNKEIYTGYLDGDLFKNEYEVFTEYTMISLFNQIRGKEFVSFSQFGKLWETAQTNSQSLKEHTEKVKLILISGIPGSGKTSMGIYLSKLLNIEGVETSPFVLPVSDSTKFASDVFLTGLIEHAKSNPTQTVVGVIQSYHHLKKAIFEFKKNAEFNEIFSLEHVITKISAKSFYRHKNRNTYQFLLENCLKGICDAIVFEKGNVSQEEFLAMRKQLCEVNDDQNILNIRGRTFEWSELSEILQKKFPKYALLYGKYFYGFEKEGKSSYYLENAVVGGYYHYRTPLREDLLDKNIIKIFDNPIEDYKELVPPEELKCDYESSFVPSEEDTDASSNKENIIQREETGSERAARHKKKQEEFENKRIQADLAQEKLLIREITKVKQAMRLQPMNIESVKGE